MNKLLEEIEWELEVIIGAKRKENPYMSYEGQKELVYEHFASWLVGKFKEENEFYKKVYK